jgi:hypothetical protein
MPRQLHDENATFEVKEADIPDVVNPDPDVTYTVRPLSTAKFREFQKRNTKMVPNKATRGMEQEVNGEVLSDDLIDFVLVSWSGINYRNEPAECNRANKLLLDGQVKQGLIGVAGLNRIAAAPAAKEDSFRPAS